MTTRILFLLFILTSTSSLFGQENTQAQLVQLVNQSKTCVNEGSKATCHEFIGKALEVVYGINDFYSAEKYLTIQQIGVRVKGDNGWKALGKAYDQVALTKAQELANSNKAVVAILSNSEGLALHIVLILPGQTNASGSWGLQVPNCVSFFTTDASKSFADKGLSYAFTKGMLKDIDLYHME